MTDSTQSAGSTLDRARTLLGKEVTVSLGEDEIAAGKLVAVSDSGEVVIVDEMGFTHWCWPMLDIHPSASPSIVEHQVTSQP